MSGKYGILGDLNTLGGPQDYLNVSQSSRKWVAAALYLCGAQVGSGPDLTYHGQPTRRVASSLSPESSAAPSTILCYLRLISIPLDSCAH